jgi:hypothetical protein
MSCEIRRWRKTGSVSCLLGVFGVSGIDFSGSSGRKLVISDHGFLNVRCFVWIWLSTLSAVSYSIRLLCLHNVLYWWFWYRFIIWLSVCKSAPKFSFWGILVFTGFWKSLSMILKLLNVYVVRGVGHGRTLDFGSKQDNKLRSKAYTKF